MRCRTHFLTVTSTLATASVAAAQIGVAPAVTYGETITDVLTQASDTLQDGSFFKSFMLAGKAGDSLALTLSSVDFDANLVLIDDQENVVAFDDDSGGRCNAHLNAVVPATGLYFAIAVTARPGDIGEFQLTLRRGEHRPSSGEPCRGFAAPQGIVTVGDTIFGAIGYDAPTLPADSTFYHVWVLAPSPEDTVTVDLFSQDFDATLFLVRGIDEVMDANDDGAGGCNARLVFPWTDGRPRRLIVRPAGQGQIGTYALRVVAGALPVLTNSQCSAQRDSVP